MSFFIGILTFFLVLNCAVLILLVLIQLPKKDAGAGLAFGGGTADALFGAGSGNALTKITKYATVVFFALALTIGILQDNSHQGNTSAFENVLKQKQTESPSATPSLAPAPAATSSNVLPSSLPAASNAPAAPAPAK